MANYLYGAKVNKYNSNELIEEIHVVARNYLEAAHILDKIVFDANMYPNIPIEIVSITRCMEVKDILNADMGEESEDFVEDPFDVSGLGDEEIIKFKHKCSNTLQLVLDGWQEVTCPDCKETILRENLENVSGIWVYADVSKKRKR